MLTGFIAIFMTIPLFLLLVYETTNEIRSIKSLTAVLDEKIPLKTIPLEQNSYIYDKNGKLISEIISNENRKIIPYENIPKHVIHSFIVMEDEHFYTHRGFDINGIARAIWVNAKNDSIEQGGSTISQQLARNLFLSNEKTYNRKLKELLYSYQLERKLSKEKILELYVNAIYFQNGIYGIETAAQFYFGKSVQQLSLAEITFLCAIPNNPTLYDPLKNYENTKKRQKLILAKLLEKGLITKVELQQAVKEQIKIQIKRNEHIDLYPDYVTYVHYELKELVSLQEGFHEKIKNAKNEAEKEKIERQLNEYVDHLLASGIKIYTGLDQNIQRIATQSLQRHLPEKVEGAAVVVDHLSHQIAAIVGGKQYKKYTYHRGFQMYRQPGSAIKPLLVYGPFIEEFHASANTTISGNKFCKGGYCPENFTGKEYGTVSLRTALKYSYNTPAVRMLDKIGINRAFQYLQPFQFQKVNHQDHSLPSAIGGFTYGMTPLELTNAYTTFANNGTYQPARAIKKITDSKGNVLYQWNDKPSRVWSSRTNDIMRDLLRDVVTSGTAKKANFPSAYIGGKTGTTNDYKDLWFIGLTDRYTAGVWVGKDRPSSIAYVSKQAPHLSIWKEIMKASQ
jgi:penicillin-binding protein 4